MPAPSDTAPTIKASVIPARGAQPRGDPGSDERLTQVGREDQNPGGRREVPDRIPHLRRIGDVDAVGKGKEDGVELDERQIDDHPDDESRDHGAGVSEHAHLPAAMIMAVSRAA